MHITPQEHEEVEPQEYQAPETVNQPIPFLERKRVRIAIASFLSGVFLCACAFLVYYIQLAKIIDERLADGPFADTVDIFASPRTVAAGDSLTTDQVVAQLRRSGYSNAGDNPVGAFTVNRNIVAINPGRHARGTATPALLEFANGKVTRIVTQREHAALPQYELEPQLITNLSDT